MASCHILRPAPLHTQNNSLSLQTAKEIDVVIRSSTEPEVNPKPYSTSQGANQDIRALKIPYISNQEGLNYEANFYGFYTQEEVQANWNWAKIFTEQEVMNFTTQRFLSLSICEYPTLEGDLSSSKELPEANPVIKFKRILSAFQKDKDQEKWTRKSEDMFNFPEPVKPVLHSPQLEANRFNQLQTRNWRPGDHLNQSGGITEVLSCTRTQEISRFNGESLKSNRSYLWKDWTIFRFDPFQAIPIQPGKSDDIQTKPRHPGDIIHEPEEFYNFIPCTSPHRNKKIPIITKLPYLESLAFKLQQLFFYQGKDEISIYQAFKKVPRKLSYPLKSSRFKQIKFLHLEPKSHKRLQRLVFKEPSIPLLPTSFHRALWRPSSHLHPLIDLDSDTHPARPVPSSFISHPLILVENCILFTYFGSTKTSHIFTCSLRLFSGSYGRRNPETTSQGKPNSFGRFKESKRSDYSVGEKTQVNESSTTCMSHLSLSKGDVTGTKEHEFKGEEPPGATPVMDQKMVQDTMQSMLLKEAKPVNEVSYQGKCLTPPTDTSTDVCVLDVGSKNESYLLTEVPQKEPDHKLSHEPPHKFYTQEEVQANWNWAKIFTEQEVMNFTTQRFLSLSICEYPTLEGDLSSSKELPEANPVIKFKRILSAFQKDKDQEKWTRKSEDMFNFPEPVKPVLHSPQLEANRFNQLQTRNWRPGDHFNQSGGIPEVLSCTRTQEISRFNGESLKSNRSYLWKDWTIFRFDPFQAIPIQPGEPDDIQTKPRHPGDIIHEPEEFYNFIPCTSPHRNKKIPIITKLPYLESLAFKLQQLFFYQGKDEISIYQAFKKVPRKLSYPLKPSRFKQIKFLHLEPKSHKRLQRLVSKEPSIPLLPTSFHRALWRPSSHLHPLIDLESDTHPARPVPSSFISHPLILVESDTHPATKIPSPSIYPFSICCSLDPTSINS
ncbi:hypothetical protein IGI04_002190 [Brassica rapa subsp. trilocularis]|uniref:Uncharacterized protein n=1 Tax=Brassica rapa subsp. trilocularis TaxID=1813537 RepID=A0ABQ7NUU0_BRACM|nr:hypothetical protein IGI04_002190 [Brassica rapa subsp. trilocularis]